MQWCYGVTTSISRVDDLLLQTLDSLKNGGFDSPYLFIDGVNAVPPHLAGYNVVCRCPATTPYGNWMAAAWTLITYNPDADYYAIFQDDIITYKNLRKYLENCPYPEKGYWNLYTFPVNERGQGWFQSNQRGFGALGLIFNNVAFRTLLGQAHLANRLTDKKRRHKFIDGAVVDTFSKIGYSEYVHSPSLVQHTGIKSSIGNAVQPLAKTFRGEDFDALQLLKDFSPQELGGCGSEGRKSGTNFCGNNTNQSVQPELSLLCVSARWQHIERDV